MLKKIKSIGILNLLIAFVSIAFLFWGVGVYITTYGDYVSSFNDESGILGNIVYVNDARSDYDYYMGLNYTYSDDGKLPTSVNKNIYNDGIGNVEDTEKLSMHPVFWKTDYSPVINDVCQIDKLFQIFPFV